MRIVCSSVIKSALDSKVISQPQWKYFISFYIPQMTPFLTILQFLKRLDLLELIINYQQNYFTHSLWIFLSSSYSHVSTEDNGFLIALLRGFFFPPWPSKQWVVSVCHFQTISFYSPYTLLFRFSCNKQDATHDPSSFYSSTNCHSIPLLPWGFQIMTSLFPKLTVTFRDFDDFNDLPNNLAQ